MVASKFVFFKGLNLPDVNGILTADVSAGLPAGEYRISSINSAANHQPALPAVAQRGNVDDISYVSICSKIGLKLSDSPLQFTVA